MYKVGFDNNKYLETQSKHIRDRIDRFGGKLYLEFGGKLFDDFHASRVLPGFLPDSKIIMLEQLKDQCEIVMTINANDIEKNKLRGDLGITYDQDVLRLMDEFRAKGLYVGSLVMTFYAGQPSAKLFKSRLESLGVKVYKHYPIEGYPSDVDRVLSREGYGRNEYIETSRPLVVVTAPGPGSGKMATCLSQLYHEHERGIKAGYAKFETFPVWNLPLNHPVNLAYEAATADLDDVNMIDPFHLAAYASCAVNYNRDVETFPVLNAMFERIWGQSPYKSPTDMGVNMAGMCIIDDEAVLKAANQEIIRRYYAAKCLRRQGIPEAARIEDKINLIMRNAHLSSLDRPVIGAALKKAEETMDAAAAMELPDGVIVTGKTSELMGPSAAVIMNALKHLAGIKDEYKLISETVIEPIQDLKVNHLGNHNPRLHSDEILIALSMCAATDPIAEKAMQSMDGLKNCECHTTVILPQVDERVFKCLGVNVTSEPHYQSSKLYHK
ncbi:MAG: DUF1846 domain-containing protein [Clostridia bacterium]|nr:DUF1846 domain-containing protein [Clostridia bacterium]